MNVVIIGETCVDKFVYCEAKRLSPEAPVPVLTPINTIENEGMAGNTKANVRALAPNSNITTIHQSSHITKTRYIESKSNHMFLRVDEGEGKICDFKWNEGLKTTIDNADIVIVSDYDKGWISDYYLRQIGLHSTLSILDSKRKLTNEITDMFTFVKLNESERNSNPHVYLQNVIITLGKRGAEYQDVIYPSPKPQDTIDVSGAGDTFTAAFIIKYYETNDEETSIKFANEMASKVVSKRGVVTP